MTIYSYQHLYSATNQKRLEKKSVDCGVQTVAPFC